MTVIIYTKRFEESISILLSFFACNTRDQNISEQKLQETIVVVHRATTSQRE
jgi:hypothetical protein